MKDTRKVEITLKTGECFESLTEFAKYTGMSLSAVSRALARGKSPDDLKTKCDMKAKKEEQRLRKLSSLRQLTESVLASGAKHPQGYSVDYLATPGGRIYNRKTGNFLEPYWANVHPDGYDAGYFYVNVKMADGRRVRHCVHILVCTAFHGVKPEGSRITVDHVDRDPKNNEASNLRWCEQRENNRNRSNHKYYDYDGQVLLLVEILEKEGIERDSPDWHYLYQSVRVTGNSPQQALLNLTHLRDTGKKGTTAKPVEVRSRSVTGIWFKSFRSLAADIGKDTATVRYRLKKGDCYEDIIERFRLTE